MSFESIHNFYERLVLKAISEYTLTDDESSNQDFLEDVACVALNNLPAKYVRYDVDLMFYMSGSEYEKIESSVTKAVKKAIDYVREHRTVRQTQKPARKRRQTGT